MRRIRFIPHDQDREDQKEEERRERKRAFFEPAPTHDSVHPRFGSLELRTPSSTRLSPL